MGLCLWALSALGSSHGIGDRQGPGSDGFGRSSAFRHRGSDTRSSATRRSECYPYEVRIVAMWASKATSPWQRSVRVRHVRRARRHVWERERLAKLASAVRQGRVPEQDLALKDIAAVKCGLETLEDEHDMLQASADSFARTWGAHRPGLGRDVGQAWARLGARIGHGIEVSTADVDAALQRLARRALKDVHSIAAEALRVVYASVPAVLICVLAPRIRRGCGFCMRGTAAHCRPAASKLDGRVSPSGAARRPVRASCISKRSVPAVDTPLWPPGSARDQSRISSRCVVKPKASSSAVVSCCLAPQRADLLSLSIRVLAKVIPHPCVNFHAPSAFWKCRGLLPWAS